MDIVTRLREGRREGSHLRSSVWPLQLAAAREIEDLRARVDDLEAALHPFAQFGRSAPWPGTAWADKSDWYYGWDCASGCNWDADAVAELKPLAVDDNKEA